MRARLAAAILCTLAAAAAWAAPEGTLINAAENKQRDAALNLIEQGADVRAKDVDGTTALHWAAHYADVALVDKLIRAGAQENVSTDYGSCTTIEHTTDV